MFKKKSNKSKEQVGTISKDDISQPSNPVHKINVIHDQDRQELVGLPRQWNGLIDKKFVGHKKRSAYVDPTQITDIAPVKLIVGQKSSLTPEQKAAGLTRKISLDRTNSLRNYNDQYKIEQTNNFQTLTEEENEEEAEIQKRSSSSSETSSSQSIPSAESSRNTITNNSTSPPSVDQREINIPQQNQPYSQKKNLPNEKTDQRFNFRQDVLLTGHRASTQNPVRDSEVIRAHDPNLVGNQNEVSPITVAAVPRTKLPPPVAPKPKILQTDNLSQGQDRTERPSSMYSYSQPYKATYQHQTQEQRQKQLEREQRDEQYPQQQQNYEQRQNYFKKMPQPHQTQRQFGSSGAQNWSPPTVSPETALAKPQHGNVIHKVRTNSGSQQVARNNSSNRSSSQEPLSSNSKTLSPIEPKHGDAKENLKDFSFPILSYDDEEYEQISQKRVREMDRRMERVSMFSSVQNLDTSHSAINNNFEHTNTNSVFKNRPNEPRPVATQQHEQPQRQQERQQRDEQHHQKHQNYEQRQNYYKKMPQPHQTQQQFGSSGAQNWSPPTVSTETTLVQAQHGKVTHTQSVARNNSSNRSSSQEPLSSNSKTLSHIEPNHSEAKGNLPKFSIQSYDDEEYEQISQKRVRDVDRRMERESMSASVQNLDISHSTINSNFNTINRNSDFDNRPQESQMSILRPRNKKMAKSATNLSQAQAGVTFKQRVKVKELDGGDERENTEEYFPLAIPAQPKQTKFDQFARRKSSGEVEAEIKPMNCMEDQSHLNDDEFKNILHSLCSNKDPKYRFKSMKKLGEGSTYTSYKAEDIFLKQTVSLKIMSIRKHARRELMFNEVLVLKEYQHPNIVGFFDSYLVGDNLWISSEYMRGGTLTSYITKRKIKFKEPQIVYIVQSLLKVLVFIHSKGIIHRDIKSDSVSLTEEGIVKLSDFGYCGQISQEYPKRRSLVGTPHWMAPEVALSRPYGTEADIWSLGILIIEIKEKQPPHFDQGLKQVMKTIADSPAPTFRDPKSASRMLIGFVAQCLEKNVLKRPSAKELLLHPLMCENLSSEVIDFVVTK